MSVTNQKHSAGEPTRPPISPPPPKLRKTTGSKTSFSTISYAQQQLGISLTESFDKASTECKAVVEHLAAQCRAKNRKFRDIEFDLQNDSQRCLHNLIDNNMFSTADVRRVKDIFENPVFYSGTSRSAEIAQGGVEDCYLIAALSNLTSIEKLVKNVCVARDEEIGIYGFLFYRDCYWVPIIIDDLLFTRVPKYEQLTIDEQELYHFDKRKYNATARKGANTLYFARPTRTIKQENAKTMVNGHAPRLEDGETWVPLIEKAYAKLHGDYASIMFGRICDATEDLTGGVATLILMEDILDSERFWHEELLKANKDRLFGCWFRALDGARSGIKNAPVDGLVGNLSHSVVRAMEIRGKRFVVLRDPWGVAGWNGPWSDGAKEWTQEWLDILPVLGHSFGADGLFVMEYKDFLTTWQEIQRTFLFDDKWIMSSQWLHISQDFPNMDAFSYGELSFTFTLPVSSPTIIVLCKTESRYFKDIQGPCIWNINFVLVKVGETKTIAESSYAFFFTRSVNVELTLEAGTYIVLPRLDPNPVLEKDYFKKGLASGWDRRKLARILTERAKSQNLAANFKPHPKHLPTPITSLLEGEHVRSKEVTTNALHTYGGVKAGENVTVTTSTTTTTTTTISKHSSASANPAVGQGMAAQVTPGIPLLPHYNGFGGGSSGFAGTLPPEPAISPPPSPIFNPGAEYGQVPPNPHQPPQMRSPSPLQMAQSAVYPEDQLEHDNSLVIGLRVYTKTNAPTTIYGQLKARISKSEVNTG